MSSSSSQMIPMSIYTPYTIYPQPLNYFFPYHKYYQPSSPLYTYNTSFQYQYQHNQLTNINNTQLTLTNNNEQVITTKDEPIQHQQQIQCDICSKIFSTNGNLKNHVLAIHENNRPYKCSFNGCNKSYSNKSRLIVHERTHTGIRPFQCKLCFKTFNEKGNLKTHMGFHLNQRPFRCKQCNKTYKTNGHLKDHIEIHHMKIKKYKCNVCNCTFGRSSTLKSHMKTHTGERNYKCLIDSCDKIFSEKGNMMKHYIRHMKKIGDSQLKGNNIESGFDNNNNILHVNKSLNVNHNEININNILTDDTE